MIAYYSGVAFAGLMIVGAFTFAVGKHIFKTDPLEKRAFFTVASVWAVLSASVVYDPETGSLNFLTPLLHLGSAIVVWFFYRLYLKRGQRNK